NRPRARKIAIQLLKARDIGIERRTLACPRAFVIGKEEDFVMLDRTAQGCAELIALQGRHRGRKEITRLDLLIAQEFVRATVKTVGAALQRGVDDGGKSVFGAHSAGQDLELFQRV